MNCFTHRLTAAVGMCAVCQKGICHECVGRETPRLVCRGCASGTAVGAAGGGWYAYAYGYEYRSPVSIGDWPLVHVCAGVDPVTMRPRVAKGVIAIGNIAVGGVAIGGLACGLFTVGGASLGLILAVGGAAIGLGLSMGGLAIGSIAIGGAALGFVYAMGGAAFGPATIDGRQCNEAARAFLRQWTTTLPPSCGPLR